MNKMTRISSLVLALMFCLALTTSAMADFEGYTSINGDETEVPKYLVLDKNAPVPEMTFTFAIRSATEAECGDNVTPGPTGATVGNVTLNSSSDTYTTAVTGNSALADVDWTAQIVAHDTFTLDFSEVTFLKPGIYRYVLTETAGALDAVTYDNSTKYVDVYVVNGTTEGTLVVQGYIVHNEETGDFAYNTDPGMTVTGKSEGFLNELETFDLTLEKKLAGNQANYDDTFAFTITVTLPTGMASATYTIETVTPTVTGATTLTATGNATVTLGKDAKIGIKGLPKGAKVDISEVNGLYTMSYTVNGTAGTVVDNNSITQHTVTADVDFVVTNTLNGTIPTGVLLTVAPFAVLMIVGLIGVVVFLKKRRD